MFYITYREEWGGRLVEIDMQYGVVFCDGMAYFTDTNGKDYKVETSAICEIVKGW